MQGKDSSDRHNEVEKKQMEDRLDCDSRKKKGRMKEICACARKWKECPADRLASLDELPRKG